jgi:hypothetical protein
MLARARRSADAPAPLRDAASLDAPQDNQVLFFNKGDNQLLRVRNASVQPARFKCQVLSIFIFTKQ